MRKSMYSSPFDFVSLRLSHIVRPLAVLLCLSVGGVDSLRASEMKIVSLGSDVTEILYALGVEDLIVAVDSTSRHPPEALKTKKNVGYLRALSAEGVLATGATRIIASESAGPPEVIAALKSSSIDYQEVDNRPTENAIVAKIRAVGAMVAADEKADQLAGRVSKEFATLVADRRQIKKPIRALFVLAVENGRATVGGRGTSADAILKLAGAENAASDVLGFKPVGDEQLVSLAPDVVVVMARARTIEETIASVRQLHGLVASPAFKDERIIPVDGVRTLGLGPRTAEAASDLMAKLYPDVVRTEGTKSQ